MIFFDKKGSSAEITASMQIFNSDGTEAEVSGNGLRCLAALLIHSGHDSNKCIYISTKAGLKSLQYISSNFPEYSFYQDMGEPIFDLSLEPADRSIPDAYAQRKMPVVSMRAMVMREQPTIGATSRHLSIRVFINISASLFFLRPEEQK